MEALRKRYLSFRHAKRDTSLVRGRHWTGVGSACQGGTVGASEVKLLRSEVAFGNEAAYGCEVASQRSGAEGGN